MTIIYQIKKFNFYLPYGKLGKVFSFPPHRGALGRGDYETRRIPYYVGACII